ncbi:MAG: hypothetical protein OEY34_00885 [Cyclobacteriaceae bacterium]|nr:hypothetical protein [Cyclobacteriaceae bacterium]
MKNLLFFCLFGLSITGCDCWKGAHGIVMDNHTKKPLDSVLVKSYINTIDLSNFTYEMETDSTGEYFGTTGNTGICKDLVMVFSKEAYQEYKIINPQSDTIWMEKK